jgi:hypothetical protein
MVAVGVPSQPCRLEPSSGRYLYVLAQAPRGPVWHAAAVDLLDAAIAVAAGAGFLAFVVALCGAPPLFLRLARRGSAARASIR